MNNSYTNRPRRGAFLYKRNVKKLLIVLVIIFCGVWAVFPLFEYHASYSMGKYFKENISNKKLSKVLSQRSRTMTVKRVKNTRSSL